ncbi:MAG: hypothetical protein K5778_04665 [Bacteroidaceae bacterium]|nr:hypothetical protein [Bacteroidaceae bacterium]
MKKFFLIALTLMSLSLSALAQDWTGRVYECNDSELLREQMTAQMKADPEFQSMDYMEKQLVSTVINCMKLKMTLKFKKDQKVTTTASVTLDTEKTKLIPGIADLREAFDEMARDMAKSMNSTDSYTIKGKTVEIDGSAFNILADGKQLQVSEDGVTLTFVRKK